MKEDRRKIESKYILKEEAVYRIFAIQLIQVCCLKFKDTIQQQMTC